MNYAARSDLPSEPLCWTDKLFSTLHIKRQSVQRMTSNKPRPISEVSWTGSDKRDIRDDEDLENGEHVAGFVKYAASCVSYSRQNKYLKNFKT